MSSEYEVINPYIYTTMNVKVSLRPEQMNNKLYINIRDNLVKKVDKKCYNNYGYIMEVYKILKIGNGIISTENFTGSSVFDINFSCKLCRVVEGVNIVCKIIKITRALSLAENGPITIIITNDKINNNIFYFDNNNYLRYKDNNKSKKVEQGDFVIVNILNKEFHHKDEKIKAIGFLKSMASEKDVDRFYEDYHQNLDQSVPQPLDEKDVNTGKVEEQVGVKDEL